MRNRLHRMARSAAATALAAMVMVMTAQQVQAETKAAAQGQAQNGQAPSGKSDKPSVMAGSPLTQIPFAVPAFPLTDDGTYRAYLNKIAADDNRQCGKQEQFGWEFEPGSQTTLDKLYSSAQSALAKNGYKITTSTSAAITDKETIAQFVDKSKRNILLVWVPLQDAALLMLCETTAVKKTK